MPSSGRRSEELQKKLQTRSNFLKASDFTKEHTSLNHESKLKDPVEKSKAALSDLRKRINERKKMSMINNQQHREGREESTPEMTAIGGNDSPALEREDHFAKDDALAQTIMRSTQKQKPPSILRNSPKKNLRNHYADPCRYRRDMIGEDERRAPPSQIEVGAEDDDRTEVSEITTDIRIMSTKGAAYAERRLAGKLQMRLSKPSLSGPPGRYLETDMNINVSNLRHLGKAVEKAKMDLKQEMIPTETRRHGLPYEDTDYRASIDEDEEGDSWEDAIQVKRQDRRYMAELNTRKNPPKPEIGSENQIIMRTSPTKKLQHLTKEAFSHEGDVFIDATEIREEDLDDAPNALIDEAHDLRKEGGNHEAPINVETAAFNAPIDVEDEEFFVGVQEEKSDIPSNLKKESVQQFQEKEDGESGLSTTSDKDKVVEENCVGSDKASGPTSMASDFYNSSVGLFKSFSNQVASQIEAIQERGLISKSDMDRMLGVLQHDVKETSTKLPEDNDDMVIMFGDELEVAACGTGLKAVEDDNESKTNESNLCQVEKVEAADENKDEHGGVADENGDRADESDSAPVEKMLESLKQSYNSGISKCGVHGDLIKENKKAIEEIVATLKKAPGCGLGDNPKDGSEQVSSKAPSESPQEGKIDESQLKELSAQGLEEMLKTPIPLTSSK